jgi:hypothetical protein
MEDGNNDHVTQNQVGLFDHVTQHEDDGPIGDVSVIQCPE